ncbi:hypothetical protein IGI04_004074 [Brassica rapa subsp. trilocularis]|uniref:Uncharacterized protein n=1 Tax=Brassica rapa subsp. trilocularis TaxID=1813537 RepID=A0ABQ7P086_BRACM|nr:hypothetical protein IGI04_004074 [Brassica rapa subsp. trilocularis]
MRLRRRADKCCGSDVAFTSKHHWVTNRRFTRIHRSSLTPHHHHRERTDVDGAEVVSASWRQNQLAERGASPRLPQHNRAFTPETDPPWAALFQSSGKGEERGNESETKIESFKSGLRSSDNGMHAHAPTGHRTRL